MQRDHAGGVRSPRGIGRGQTRKFPTLVISSARDFWYTFTMNQSETPQSSRTSYFGQVRNGVVVLDSGVGLADGQTVRVEPVGSGAEDESDADRAERVRRLQQLLADWTEEDGELTDEEADRLRVALDRDRGVTFRSMNLD